MTEFLDLTEYHCPIPLLLTKQALKKLDSGNTLEIHFGGTSAVSDFKILCEEINAKIISYTSEKLPNGQYRYKMKISN